jgi:hypothetical protein
VSSLTVRVNDHTSDRDITDYVSGLKFRKAAPGGHHSASCNVSLPYRTFTDLGPADRMYVYDSRTGSLLWEGYTNNPGATAGVEGESFELSASGGMVRASDERRSLVYIDTDLTAWARSSQAAAPASATAAMGVDPAGALDDGLLTQFTPGSAIATNAIAQLGYAFSGTDMEFGACQIIFTSGKADAGYNVEMVGYGGPSPSEVIVLGATITAGARTAAKYAAEGAGHPVAGRNNVGVRMKRIGGATNVADDTTWTLFNAVTMLGRRVDRYGALKTGSTGMSSNLFVRADWVVEDLLGRLLSFCDPDTSSISATAAQIDQMSYRGGTTAAGVLEELALHEPDFLWEVLESGAATGLHRFSYREWPAETEVRYEVSTKDGYSAPGSDNDLCNRIAVEWVDATKDPPAPQVTVRTTTVQALTDAGIVRDAERITLPEGSGSLANAQRVGDAVLARLATPPRAATAVVNYPILDRTACKLVHPRQVIPGYNVRVRETGDVLRLTETEYDHDAGAVTLTLGTPVQSTDQIIARLLKVVK